MRDKLFSRLCMVGIIVPTFLVLLWITGPVLKQPVRATVGIEIPQESTSDDTADVDVSLDLTAMSQPDLLSGLSEVKISPVSTATDLICEGQFEPAKDVVDKALEQGENNTQSLQELSKVIADYEKIDARREEQRRQKYQENLTELEKVESGDVNDVNDVNDGYAFTRVFSAVAKVRQYATEQQQEQLIKREKVLQAIAESKLKAEHLEAEGEWIDSYLASYSWLTALDPENEQYKDYSEQLLEKADIVASFQDSPCETARERFDNVNKRMFIRAIDSLNFNYVSKIDYKAMAAKGVRRCKSLAEVMLVLSDLPADDPNRPKFSESFEGFVMPDRGDLEALVSGLAGLMADVEETGGAFSKDRFISVFEIVLELNGKTANLPDQLMVIQFADGSLKTLDPYTVMVWPKQVEDFEKLMTNEFTGIGIEINKTKGKLTVGSLLPDTPASYSGLDAGDVIEKVDGQETKDMSLNCAVKYITGPAGTDVTLTIRRPGEQETLAITITRAKIVVPTIRGWQRSAEGKWRYMVDDSDRIGYVRITDFSAETAADLEKTLEELEARGMQGLVLDLRYNTGGYLDSAIDVADKFLSDGLIVMTRPRFGMPSYAAAKKRGTHPDYPMVVLVNGGSASASEIVAGALADPAQQRAILVGTRTFGKGLVQGITHYPGDGAQLKYTMARYHLPSGQKVKSKEEAEKEGTKDWGVAPTIEVKMRDDELREMLDIQRNNDVLVQAGHDDGAVEFKKSPLSQVLEVDPQLSIGILVIKSELIRNQSQQTARKAA